MVIKSSHKPLYIGSYELIISLLLDLIGRCQRIKERGKRFKGGVGTKEEAQFNNMIVLVELTANLVSDLSLIPLNRHFSPTSPFSPTSQFSSSNMNDPFSDSILDYIFNKEVDGLMDEIETIGLLPLKL